MQSAVGNNIYNKCLRPQSKNTILPYRLVIFQDYDTKDLGEFQDIIMKGCDFNRDGKISKKELTMIQRLCLTKFITEKKLKGV